MSKSWIALVCSRCGRQHRSYVATKPDLCRDCRYVEPTWPDIAKPRVA